MCLLDLSLGFVQWLCRNNQDNGIAKKKDSSIDIDNNSANLSPQAFNITDILTLAINMVKKLKW